MSVSGRVAIVTDSTSDLPAEGLVGTDIDIVPVQVVVSGKSFDETSDAVSTRRIADALTTWQPVSTSRPTPERFRQAFAKAAVEGATGVVCVTLSAAMSATYESAWIASREVDIDVRVVDSASVAMGLGFAVLAGEQLSREGANLDQIEQLVLRKTAGTTIFFSVNTLEYLRRSGRISSARAAVGQALKVKPILTLRGGEVVSLEKTRTNAKAMARMVQLVTESVHGPVEIAVQHLDAQERASQLSADLHLQLPGTSIVQCSIGAVVAAHTGPGIVATVISPLN